MHSSGLRSRHVFLGVVLVCLIGAFLYHNPPFHANGRVVIDEASKGSSFNQPSILQDIPCHNTSCPLCETPTQNSKQYEPVRAKPTHSFRDGLHPEVNYITAWHAGGFTNDVMGIANLIYIAQMANRTPILPPFAGFFQQENSGPLSFGEIFDIPRLQESLHMPILEWQDVKDLKLGREHSPEPLGCWSVWAPYDGDQKWPRRVRITEELNLDLSYTPIMEPVKLSTMEWPNDPHVNLNKLVRLSYHDAYVETTRDHKPVSYPDFPSVYPPDEHLMCIDFLYWASILKPFEWDTSYSPGWKIAKNFRWTPKMTSLAEEYLMRLFGVSSKDQIPHFIAIHIRRRDFAGWCGGVPLNDCFAPLDAYAVRVQEIQHELQSKWGTETLLKVVVSSDEQDPLWWEEVRKRGWLFVDHGENGENTAKYYGAWNILVLDLVIHTLGKGFIGTDQSTLSLLSQRRVEEWHGGITRTVKWGHPGADNH